MTAQDTRGATGDLGARPDAAAIEQEVARLPDVVACRLAVNDKGVAVAAQVMARDGSVPEAVALDVQSVVAVVSGEELPLEQIVVAQGSGVDRRTFTSPAPSSLRRWGQNAVEPDLVTIDLRDPAPLDAAAARLLERALRSPANHAASGPPDAVPTWEQLLRLSQEPERVSQPERARPNPERAEGRKPPMAARCQPASLHRDIFVKPSRSRGLVARSLGFLRIAR